MSKFNYESMMQMLRIQRYKEFENYEKVIKLGINTMWKELCDTIKNPDLDPTDIFADEMESLRNQEYSMQLMSICCLSETWEQDLYNFLKEKNLIEVYSNDYRNTKRIFETAYPTCAISNYKKIEEMRSLVNAIKHGEGNSLTDIRRITSDKILADSNIGTADESGRIIRKKLIEFDNNTLTSRTLNVDGLLPIYIKTIIKFWEDVFTAEKQQLESHETK